MTIERIVVREISWRCICPWLILFRTFGLAISIPVLFLATLGSLTAPLGWQLSDYVFGISAEAMDPPFRSIVQSNGETPGQWLNSQVPNGGQTPTTIRQILSTQPDNLHPLFHQFIRPFAAVPDAVSMPRRVGYLAVGIAWMLVVWGFFGGAISRMAVVKLGREERIGLGEAVAHATRKLGAYIGSPLFPLVGVVLLALPIYALGWLLRIDIGVLVASLLWPLVLLGGLLMTLLLIGLLFGWPLMWGAISAEQDADPFEAFSRSYSYTFQRPLHYLFYAALATLFSGVCWLLVYHAGEWVIASAHWPAALGAGTDRWQQITIGSGGLQHSGTGLLWIGSSIMGLSVTIVRCIVVGFAYALFWCLAAAIYLLLRRDVDQTEFDEVFVENENTTYRLPETQAPAAK